MNRIVELTTVTIEIGGW